MREQVIFGPMLRPLTRAHEDLTRRFIASAERKGFTIHTEPTEHTFAVVAVRERDDVEAIEATERSIEADARLASRRIA